MNGEQDCGESSGAGGSVLREDLLLGVTPGLTAARAVEQQLVALVDQAAQTHARLLADVGAFAVAWRAHCDALGLDPTGSGSSTTAASLAVVLRCTEHRAHELLRHADTLRRLDRGLALLDTWTPEQLGKVLDELDALTRTDPALADQVVDEALRRGRQVGTSTLVRTVRRVVARLTGEQAADRRRKATAQRRVEVTPLPDGQAALWVTGPALDITRMARAIRAHATHPSMSPLRLPDGEGGVIDDRTLDNVRFDALLDLLVGRGCGQHTAPLPTVLITIPVQTALDRADEPAALHGTGSLDGPVDADAARTLLTRRDVELRPLPVDAATGAALDAPGRPVRTSGTGSGTGTGSAALRATLLRMLHDVRRRLPDQPSPADCRHGPPGSPPDGQPDGQPDNQQDSYRPGRRLQRYLHVRSPRCEWPGCARPATTCDLDHDTPWPHGPTCACSLGPLCRHHHRAKQTGWTKHRDRDTTEQVRWTSPLGTLAVTWCEHEPPLPPVRPLPALVVQGLGLPDHLRPHDPEHDPDPPDLQHWLDHPRALLDPGEDPDPDRTDRHLTDLLHDTSWTLDLDDPYGDLPHPATAA